MNHEIITGDCADVLENYAGQADLILTSPPYDALRDYGGHGFDFNRVADACVPALADGGVLVWVVSDQTIDGSESGTSFRQALGFMERGLKLHDTMIYAKAGPSHAQSNRYYQVFEYMFVLSKGSPKTVNLIADRKNRWRSRWGYGRTSRTPKGDLTPADVSKDRPETGVRFNIWEYQTAPGYMHESKLAYEHPATFPYRLAADHVKTWTDPGDLVIDPMCGSGTAVRAAVNLGRRAIGVEIHPPYADLARRRMAQAAMDMDGE